MAASISEDCFYPVTCDQRLWLGRQAYLKDNADHFENWATQFPGNVFIMFIFLINIYKSLFPEVIS